MDFGKTIETLQQRIEIDKLKCVLERLRITEIFCLMIKMVEVIEEKDYNKYHFCAVRAKESYKVFELMLNRPKDNVLLTEKSFLERFKIYFLRYQQISGLFRYLPVKRIKFVEKSLKELFSISFRKILHVSDNKSLKKEIIARLH